MLNARLDHSYGENVRLLGDRAVKRVLGEDEAREDLNESAEPGFDRAEDEVMTPSLPPINAGRGSNVSGEQVRRFSVGEL